MAPRLAGHPKGGVGILNREDEVGGWGGAGFWDAGGACRRGGGLGSESGRPVRGGGELVHAGEGARDEVGSEVVGAGRASR